MAAVLACGDGAVLSHRSAATLWRIRDGEGPHADVTIGNDSKHPAIAIHRSPLGPQDVTVHRGIPVTSVARTLADSPASSPRMTSREPCARPSS